MIGGSFGSNMNFRSCLFSCSKLSSHYPGFSSITWFCTGEGSYTFPDGRIFKGIYKDDQPDGNGTQTSPDGSVLYDREWSMGEFLGSCV